MQFFSRKHSSKKQGARPVHESVLIAKILSHAGRFLILHTLITRRDEELCVRQLSEAAGLSQSATSHQLALLEAWGLVYGERMGQTVCYYITDSVLAGRVEKTINVLSV